MNKKYSEFKIFAQEAESENTSGERLKELAALSLDLARLVASNPATPLKLLQELTKRRDSTIRENLTGNFNTPINILLKLGKDYPAALFNNPIWYLIRLDNPTGSKIPSDTLISLLEYDSKIIFEKIEQDSIFITASWLKNLASHSSYRVRCCVVSHPNTPVDILEKLSLDVDASVRCCVASHPNTPVYLLERFVTDNHYSVLESLLKVYNLPVYLLEKLASNTPFGIRASIADNPNTPVCILEQLAKDNEFYIRAIVSKNSNSPVYLLEKLAFDIEAHVRCAIASNPNTPIYILEQLAKNHMYEVRQKVAGNINTPTDLLEKMAKNVFEKWMVLKVIAKNPNTPIEILQEMAKDRRKSISNNAIKNLHSQQINPTYHNKL